MNEKIHTNQFAWLLLIKWKGIVINNDKYAPPSIVKTLYQTGRIYMYK